MTRFPKAASYSAFAVTVAFPILACGIFGGANTRPSISIAHPAHAGGQIQPNVVRATFEGAESSAGLPAGSLSNEATLISFTPEQVCFNVTIRDYGNHAQYVNPSAWTIWLGVTNPEGKIALRSPTVNEAQMTMQNLNGSRVEQYQTGSQTSCDNQNCTSVTTRPTYGYTAVPQTYTVATGGGQICFASQGAITPQTESIELMFDLNAAQETDSDFSFEWELEAPGR